MATPGSTACVISGLPLDITLGDVEALVSPKCSGRIISIAIEGEGIANVDFALQADCETMLGDHLVKGGTVKISRPGEPVLPPMRPAEMARVPCAYMPLKWREIVPTMTRCAKNWKQR